MKIEIPFPAPRCTRHFDIFTSCIFFKDTDSQNLVKTVLKDNFRASSLSMYTFINSDPLLNSDMII